MIKAIYMANERGSDQRRVDTVEWVSGKGIVGDRNFAKTTHRGQNVTFVEKKAMDNYNLAFCQTIDLSSTRRNVVTSDIKLNDLVGKEFQIGQVEFKGVALCEPCTILGRLLGCPKIGVRFCRTPGTGWRW